MVSIGMFLQKAMKQGRNVHGISHVILYMLKDLSL